MYKIEFLPLAKMDIDEIIYYVYHDLKNVMVAKIYEYRGYCLFCLDIWNWCIGKLL